MHWKQDPLHDGEANQTIPHGRVRQGDFFFGHSKSDLAGDKLGLDASQCDTCPLRAEPEHQLQIQQRDKWLNKHQLCSDLHFHQA